MKEPYVRRCRRLMRLVARKGAGAFLVTKAENVRYLSGFTGEDSWLVLAPRRRILIADSRFTEEAALSSPGWEVVKRKGGMAAEAAGVLRHIRAKAAFEAANVTVETHKALLRRLGRRRRLVATGGLVESLRTLKDEAEIAYIRKAIAAAERGFKAALGGLRKGADESSFAADLERAMRMEGADGAAFPTIAACEPKSSLPHAKPGHKRLSESGTLLVDWGARVGGYNSDLTRVIAWGKVTPDIRRMWGVVRAAQAAALRIVRPGVPAARVDAAARKVISQAGFGKCFGHGLGHGVGLEVHEGPTLSPKSKAILKAGMVVTIEPGIYLPGVGGVRVEDMVLVTRRGAEVLTHVSREGRVLAGWAGARL